MVADKTKAFTGRKAQIGKITGLPNCGGLGVQAGYCTGCHAKQLMTLEEARSFAKMFYRQKGKLVNRLIIRLLQRLETTG